MWGLITGALSWIVKYILGAGSMKWIITSLLLLGLSALITLGTSLLPAWFSDANFSNSFSTFTPSLWYFFDYFKLDYAFGLILGAYITRFLIRRIPFIG